MHEADFTALQLESAVISGAAFPKPVELITISMTAGGTAFLPRRQPLLWQRANGARSASAILVNGPSLEFSHSTLTFAHGNFRIALREFGSIPDARRQTRRLKDDCIATSAVDLTTTNGGELDPEAALARLST